MIGEPLPLPPLPCAGWLRVWPLRAMRARAAVRHALEQVLVAAAAGHAGVPPATVAVRRNPAGRPGLEGLPPGYGCSLAYTHGLALAALACGPAVGVDCENLDSKVDWAALAAEYFCGSESPALAAHPGQISARTFFFRLWARHEAQAKRSGLGVRALDARSPLGEVGCGAAALTQWVETGPGVWVIDLPLGGNLVGSVALAARPGG